MLARCLELLVVHGGAAAIAAECAAWRSEVDGLAGRLQSEEQGAAQSAAVAQQRLATLDRQLGAVQQRMAAIS